ncbi:hypothetical protein SLS56_011916, partial [Neofusicoccum ribis]
MTYSYSPPTGQADMAAYRDLPVTFPVIACWKNNATGEHNRIGQLSGDEPQHYLTATLHSKGPGCASIRLCLSPLVIDNIQKSVPRPDSCMTLVINADHLLKPLHTGSLLHPYALEIPDYVSEELQARRDTSRHPEKVNVCAMNIWLKHHATVVMPSLPGILTNSIELEHLQLFRDLSMKKMLMLWFLFDIKLKNSIDQLCTIMQRNGDKDLPPIPLSHNTSSDRLRSPRPRSHDAEATSSGKARQDEKEGQKPPGDKSATPDMIIDSEPVHIQATSQTRQHFSHDRAAADTEKTFESEYLPQRMVQPQSVLVVQAQTPTKDHSHSTAKHQSTKPAPRHILDLEESACTEFIEEPPMTFPVIVCRDDKKAGGEEYLGQFNGTKSQQYLTAEFNISNRNMTFLHLCLDPLVVDTNRTFSFKSTSRISLIITLDNLMSTTLARKS